MGNIPFATPWPTPCRGFPISCVIFSSLGEAANPIAEADRHAKKELKKQVRGVRPLERELEGRTDEEAEAVRGYCLAVRSALTDDGRSCSWMPTDSSCRSACRQSATRSATSRKKGASRRTRPPEASRASRTRGDRAAVAAYPTSLRLGPSGR